MAKKVQLMTNPKQWQVVDGVEVLVDVPQEDLDPITDSSCVEIEGHRTLEETINQENMFTPQITETKVRSKVGGVYHDNVVDGAYEEAILYGNTQVNLVESVTTGSKYIPHAFTSFQGNERKIGIYHSGRTNQVAPLVKGVTMVNLCQETSVELAQGQSLCIDNIKGSTEYTVSFTFTQKNSGAGIVIQSYNDTTYLENSKLQSDLGDEVVMTFTTHENANKVYINNGVGYGGETIQLDNIMVIEGDVTDLDLPFFKGMHSVELSRPLTNLFTDDLVPEVMGVTVTNSGGTVTVTSTTTSQWASARYYLDLKPNTKYVIMWDGLTFTQTAGGIDYIISVCENDTIFTHMGNKFTTLRSIVFDTGDKNAISIRIHATTSNSETGTTTVKGLRVFEWDDSLRSVDLQSLGYFSGTKYVSARALETEGKNLYPHGDINFTPTDDKVDNWYDAKGTMYMYGDVAQKSKSRFLLKKGTYTIRFGTLSNIDAFQLIDDKEALHGKIQSIATPTTFTLKQDTYCTLRLKATSKNVATTVTGIQIERGETATTYETYQSSYYKPRETEEIILRSLPNGVCDTFNLQTGELVQRIGEIILDENESWSQDITASESTPNTNIFYTTKHEEFKPLATAQRESGLLCDKMKVIASLFSLDVVGVMTNLDPRAYIRLPKNVAPDVTSLKTYLQSNPMTVQYELAEPIITKLQTYDRIYSGQTNGLMSMGNNLSALTYYSNNYYLKVGNLSPVPAILEPITTIPYDVRLKPSTLYTIKYNRGGYSNSMKFDLGGSVVEKTNSISSAYSIAEEFTVRTPAILSHEQLILSGTGYAYNFIIVEGDITGTELPYFEGMKDVKMPIVKNVGKNLLDESSMSVKKQSDITLRYYKAFPCKPNTTYYFYADKGESQCNWYEAHSGEDTVQKDWQDLVYIGYTSQVTTSSTCRYLVLYTGCAPDIDPHTIKTRVYEELVGGGITNLNSYQQHRENSVYAVQGEYPITSEMMEQGGFSMSGFGDGSYEKSKYDNTARLRSKDLIPVKPNTTYAFSHSFSKFGYNVYQWNGSKKFIDGVARYFANGQVETITTTADTQYIHFLMSKDDASQAITVAEYDWSQFHLYELDSTINLRSLPNGVKDELNLLTGEYIQRVGEKIIDGYETLIVIPQVETGVYRYENDFITSAASTIATIPQTVVGNYTNPNYNGFYYLTGDGISFIRHDMTLDEFYEYLKSNPITVQYELKEPIISHVRLVSNNQEREVGVKLPNGVCNTYNSSTGITTVRVGKIVLDGSESWYFSTTKTNTQVFGLTMSDIASTQNNLYCETMRVASGMDAEIIATNGGGLFIALLKTKASTVDELKTYLASNPVTVWYELKYPQIQPDIVLPNGVHDEYNPETGVYTKKVGFIEFDGSADELWSPQVVAGNSTHCYASIFIDGTISPKMKYMVNSDEVYIVSDSFETVSRNNFRYDTTEIYVWSGRTVYVNMPQTNLIAIDLVSWRNYLSQNPIKLWYELETPVTYQLTPYFGLPQPYAYEDGYLIHDSAYAETTLPPEFKYKLVANRTGQVMQNNRKLQEHTTRLSDLEAIIIEATIESLFNRELQLFELELMDIQLIDLGE